ncbi:FAD-binding oxidoreductase [Paraglaciecola polaris]|uniref:Pyridoxamine 5'-phosphate oxidase-related FMN-binding n=1 Tax=Paraglaciecola polaris LMG 21857 TaxID=1129793 RepID=K6Z549_9ALTE|nr:FAD-binding oxidoreductase [Paraglaciecola polaris]GAC31301.1 pyridoxamine 5'-phosphate oxidase-related FMN-binding [Paraglaciecola polaris LMG 21857]
MIPNDRQAPFHIGEQQMQNRAGKLEHMDAIGRRAIRSFMPDQHREFFKQLPFVVVGSTDENQQLWASILPGSPGFIQSPTPTELSLNSKVLKGDPLLGSLTTGARLGLLGIEVPTRRRNRVNARISHIAGQQLTLEIEQSFGNCPQYIQTRDIRFIRSVDETFAAPAPEYFKRLDTSAKNVINQADTFFVASSAGTTAKKSHQHTLGVDVSHRGGMPGFVGVNNDNVPADILRIPDYAGNNFFNTMGNFLVNPKAGLIFTDFTTGDLLMLTGTVEVLLEDDPRIVTFKGAQRGWQFTLSKGIRLKNALPFRASFSDYSPNTMQTGTWQHADAVRKAQETRNRWQTFKVGKIVDESTTIRSFYLTPNDASAVLPFNPGQHLTLRIPTGPEQKQKIRNYTVSSAPGADHYRISVKREPHGLVSKALHDTLSIGSLVDIKAPQGEFHIDNHAKRPAVLIGAGVGITPMIAMAQDALNEGLRTRYTRPMTIIHSAKNNAQRAFSAAFKDLESKSAKQIRYYSVLSSVPDDGQSAIDYHAKGRITAELLQPILDLNTAHKACDIYLCGPQGFMQAMYDTLISLNIADDNIHAETFGPSTLIRQAAEAEHRIEHSRKIMSKPKNTIENSAENEAQSTIISFTESKFEQPWHKGEPTILEVAEAHGLAPDFSCRSGSCGSCTVKLTSGAVTYRSTPSAPIEDNEVLICCAVPAKGCSRLDIAL